MPIIEMAGTNPGHDEVGTATSFVPVTAVNGIREDRKATWPS